MSKTKKHWQQIKSYTAPLMNTEQWKIDHCIAIYVPYIDIPMYAIHMWYAVETLKFVCVCMCLC